MGGGVSDSQMHSLTSCPVKNCDEFELMIVYQLQIKVYTWISMLERNRVKTSGLPSAELLSDFMGRNHSPSRECSGNNWVHWQLCRAFRRI